MNDRASVGRLRSLLFISLLGVLGFKGDACICGGSRPQPPPPSDSVPSAAPAGSAAPSH